MNALVSEEIEVNGSVESNHSVIQSLEDCFKMFVSHLNPNTANPTLDMLTMDANV
jgi:hypothetical protein